MSSLSAHNALEYSLLFLADHLSNLFFRSRSGVGNHSHCYHWLNLVHNCVHSDVTDTANKPQMEHTVFKQSVMTTVVLHFFTLFNLITQMS